MCDQVGEKTNHRYPYIWVKARVSTCVRVCELAIVRTLDQQNTCQSITIRLKFENSKEGIESRVLMRIYRPKGTFNNWGEPAWAGPTLVWLLFQVSAFKYLKYSVATCTNYFCLVRECKMAILPDCSVGMKERVSKEIWNWASMVTFCFCKLPEWRHTSSQSDTEVDCA